MSKYYIPEITEFYVGFEYERWYEVSEFSEGQSGWISCTFPNDPIYGGMLLPHRFKVDNTRVKYLDQEDIESLGFIKKHQLDNRIPRWIIKHFKNSSKEEYDEFINNNLEETFILEKDELNFDLYKYGIKLFNNLMIIGKITNSISIYEEDTIFKGIIKNKSELKKLLKQLNIM